MSERPEDDILVIYGANLYKSTYLYLYLLLTICYESFVMLAGILTNDVTNKQKHFDTLKTIPNRL